MLSVAASDVTINDICLVGDATSAILNVVGARFRGNRISVSGNHAPNGIGVRFGAGSAGSVLSDSSVTDIANDGIGIGSSTTGSITLQNVDCHNVDTAFVSGDCVQAYDGTAADLTIDGGLLSRRPRQSRRLSISEVDTLPSRVELT